MSQRIKNMGTATAKFGEGIIVEGHIPYQVESIQCKGILSISGSSSKYFLPNEDGTEEQVMQTDGQGMVSWVSLPEQNFTVKNTVVAGIKVDATYVASPWEFIPCDCYNNNVIVSLPQAGLCQGAQICVKVVGPTNGNEVRLNGYLSMDNIDGATPYVLANDWAAVTIVSTGSDWLVMSTV